MKTGSIIARMPGTTFFPEENIFGMQFRSPPRVPKANERVILLDWKFGNKWEKEQFYLFIDGFSELIIDTVTYYFWWPYSAFKELQPPMDLSFIEGMKKPVIRELTLKSLSPEKV